MYGYYADARPNETKLIQYLEEVGADWEGLAKSLLGFLSDDDVRNFAEGEGYDLFDEEEDEEEIRIPLLDGVKIEDRTNLWSEIDRKTVDGVTYCLMENDTWGDEAMCLVIKIPDEEQYKTLKSGKTVRWIPAECEICETYDNLETALTDEDII